MKPFIKPMTQTLGDLFRSTKRLRHCRQFGCGDGHAKQTHGQCVETLSVGQRYDCALAQEACEPRIHEGADLDHAAADKDREKLSTNLTSLNPDSDRAAMVVAMIFTAEGVLEHAEVYAARVHNRAKLAYDSVTNALRGCQPSGQLGAEQVQAIFRSFETAYP